MSAIEEGRLPLVDHDSATATATASSRARGEDEARHIRTLARAIGGPPKPDNFDPLIAARCMYWANGMAYASFKRGQDGDYVPGGLNVGPEDNYTLLHSSNELMINIDKSKGEVLIVFRGTADKEDILYGTAAHPTPAPSARGRGPGWAERPCP